MLKPIIFRIEGVFVCRWRTACGRRPRRRAQRAPDSTQDHLQHLSRPPQGGGQAGGQQWNTQHRRTKVSFVFCLKFFVFCLLSFVLCPLSCVLCPLSFVLCPLSFVLCPLSFVLCPLSFVFCLKSVLFPPSKSQLNDNWNKNLVISLKESLTFFKNKLH